MGSSESVILPHYPSFDHKDPKAFESIDDSKVFGNNPFLNKGFYSIWSALRVNGDGPGPRIAQCCAYSKEQDIVAVAYGADPNNNILSDVWVLNFNEYKWTQVNIDINLTTPRAGGNGVIIGNDFWIFGGFYDKEFLGDLHVINLSNGEIKRPKTTGIPPENCSSFVMSTFKNKIIILGGYNGAILSQLSILDIDTMNWTTQDSQCPNCKATSCVLDFYRHQQMYIYGSTRYSTIMRIDENSNIELIKGGGEGPAGGITRACMTSFDRYLILIGGEMPPTVKKKFSPLYIFDTETQEWEIFHVLPDGRTVSFVDGEIDYSSGEFSLPHCIGSSALYRQKTREVDVLFGKPFSNGNTIYVLSVAEPLSFIHLQTDLIDAYLKTCDNKWE